MSTYEDRLDALEQKVADIQLERLYERKVAAQSTSSEQSYDARQINHRLTMLLGVTTTQEEDLREVKKRLIALDDRLSGVDQRMESHFEALEKRLSGLETKFDEHSTILAQHTTLLTQILARLPEKSS
ncbi:hypothetical protein [Ktedonobacter racemifer]|uniref:Uncharacterized protein n=1 Tax=Ktedonobacter racemifer DSM 44963 TaxID=485913 RepID=D6TKT8_KTERA|nr:hypothetical protein [Ktedonobacter racemifer]EFH86388.1 hypothetical protein Krac_7683 [Ktedonobacter racemifer DSM 44963]